ncbi:MAG: Coq4 family protein [Halieaceae bacterium]|jgi:ubiquinone biosynthesis protein Coq4|nr:Coq4 family protein [Halieaceae bacterium]
MTDVPSYESTQRLLDPRKLGTTTMLSSTSKYLNHPGLRHWVAVESLRRNGPDMDHYGGPLEIIEIFRELDDKDEINRLFAEARKKDAALDAWFEARYLIPHDMEALAELPEGTLGREYQKMMAEQGLQADFLPFESTASDYDYFMRRHSQTHDIEHQVLGYRYDPLGEFALIAARTTNLLKFLGQELGEHLSVVSNLLVSTGIARFGCHYPHLLPPLYKALGEGNRIGEDLKVPLFMPRYEEMFDWPVEAVREELGVRHSENFEDTMWSLQEYFDAA